LDPDCSALFTQRGSKCGRLKVGMIRLTFAIDPRDHLRQGMDCATYGNEFLMVADMSIT